jgi:Thioredoxin
MQVSDVSDSRTGPLALILRHIARVHTYYYTDPMCPWSWAIEPALRKLAVEFGGRLEVRYVMCGMARESRDTGPFVSEMLEAADRSGMPVDARLWLAAPPRSSHPACLAVKAASEQGDPVYGPTDYGTLRAAAVAAGATPTSDPTLSVDEALRRFGTMATAEIALVCDLPGPRAPAELWRLALEWRVRPERLGTGYLWSPA